jgi:hypothetical protein
MALAADIFPLQHKEIVFIRREQGKFIFFSSSLVPLVLIVFLCHLVGSIFTDEELSHQNLNEVIPD